LLKRTQIILQIWIAGWFGVRQKTLQRQSWGCHSISPLEGQSCWPIAGRNWAASGLR
jgi:hypothetical protein